MKQLVVLSLEDLQNRCRVGQGDRTCAFLWIDKDWGCAKGTPQEKHVRTSLETGQWNARGDNCSGPPHFVPI